MIRVPRPPSVRWPQAHSSREGGAQCISRNTREGFCWPSFQQSSGGVPVRKSVSASEMCEQEILEATKRRDVLKAEVVAGEERLAGLKTELTRAASAPLPVPTDVGVCEIEHLKARLAAAEEERDAALRSNSSKRQATMPRTSGFAHGQTTSLPCRLWCQQN